MLYVSFNQDSTCFACGREDGFIVYNCDPATERFNRLEDNQSEPNGVGIVEMLFRSNIFALVGGGQNPKYPRNQLMIWDDFQTKAIAELEFITPVTGVKLRRDMILVTIHDKAYKYKLANLRLLSTYDVYPNPKGLIAMTASENIVIAVPGNVAGSVIIDNHSYGTEHIITAHSNPLSALALNADGSRLATASDRGTLIRVWNTLTGEKVREFRRGLEVVTITSLAFDLDSTRLVVCSDKGTTHIFSLLHKNPNRKSNLAYISDYLPAYFNSEWSSVSFEVPPKSICTFSANSIDTVYAITPNAQFLKYNYNTKTGTGQCIEAVNIESLNNTDS